MISWSTAFCAYAPQVGRSDDEKDDFLGDLLFNVVGNISASEMIVVVGTRMFIVRMSNVRTSDDCVIDLVLFNLCYC